MVAEIGRHRRLLVRAPAGSGSRFTRRSSRISLPYWNQDDPEESKEGGACKS